jgi:hypothetical protein
LDEPEAALLPQRQLSLIGIINELEKTKQAQCIIATHSPILMVSQCHASLSSRWRNSRAEFQNDNALPNPGAVLCEPGKIHRRLPQELGRIPGSREFTDFSSRPLAFLTGRGHIRSCFVHQRASTGDAC